MDESYAIRRYEQAAALLPLRWQQQARQLPPRQMARAEELRLRAGGPMTVLLPEGEITPGQGGQSPTVTQTDLEQLCDAVTDYSRYAAGETRAGAISPPGAASGWACAAPRCCGRGSTPTCGTSRR